MGMGHMMNEDAPQFHTRPCGLRSDTIKSFLWWRGICVPVEDVKL